VSADDLDAGRGRPQRSQAMNADLHPHIQQCLEDSWAALDVIDEGYADGLTPEQRTKVQRARELVAEVLVEVEEGSY
jgi:hypothetical protein